MLLGRRHQSAPGRLEIPRGQQMRRDQGRRRSVSGQRAGQRPVQAPAARPRDIGVCGFPGQRMAEGGPPVPAISQQPRPGEPVRPGRHATGRDDDIDVELVTGHRGGFHERALLVGQPRGPQQHCLPDAIGYRCSPRARERDRAVAVGEMAAIAQREGQFLDGEREPVSPPSHHRRQRRLRHRPEQPGQHPGYVLVTERRQLYLGELMISPQQGPNRPEAMAARKLVATVTADHGDREAATRISQGRQQAERSLVGPLQVVEEQSSRDGPRPRRSGPSRRPSPVPRDPIRAAGHPTRG